MITYKIKIHFTEVLLGKVTHICEFTLDYDNQVTYNTLKSDAFNYVSKLNTLPKNAIYIRDFEYTMERL